MTLQPGILALGTTEHLYVRGALVGDATAAHVVWTVLSVVEDLSTTSGANVVVGFRPELWPGLVDQRPDDARSFTEDVVGPDGFTMPATQDDVWLWFAAGSRSAVFDAASAVLGDLAGRIDVRSETDGWAYGTDRDLTGFIDGSANPSMLEASAVVSPDGRGCLALIQRWAHDAAALARMSTREQELMMGRTKADSIEMSDEEKPPSSHVARTTVTNAAGEEMDILRRNTATGTPSAHGTNFVGFGADRARLQMMLERMAGVGDGIRDALTLVASAEDGGYYFAPSVEEMAELFGTRPAPA